MGASHSGFDQDRNSGLALKGRRLRATSEMHSRVT
jgi:hypothetical protein